MALPGLAISRYRSFGSELQYLAPLSKVNLVVGQNNVGKSNILTYAQRVLSPLSGQGRPRRAPALTPLDTPAGLGNEPTQFAIAISPTDAIARIAEGRNLTARVRESLEAALRCSALHPTGPELVWIPHRRAGEAEIPREFLVGAVEEFDGQGRNQLEAASRALTSGYGPPVDDLGRVLAAVKILDTLPQVATVEAFRQVRAAGGLDGYSGTGLIDGLAQLQNPPMERRSDRQKFGRINLFVQSVLEDSSASLEIPYERNTIIVHLGRLELPIENLGTGIHEVIIIAAACTLLDQALVCIEEPEIHLHPLLQRKLMSYLAAETTNQYLVATHSASIVDSNLGSIFHISKDESGSTSRRASSPSELAEVCADLGYRASDLVQTNSVVWVEGPSDRLYLLNWLRSVEPDLIEGVHFSIMFYGGRLLSHLSADDPSVDDFISLRRLNRNIAILIDSDASAASARLSDTKVRVRDEFDRGPGFAWITHGYCIENYLSRESLKEAISKVHPAAPWKWDSQRFHNPFSKTATSGRDFDKVGIAHAVVDSETIPDRYDLAEKLGRLSSFIRAANGLPPRG